jgi:hypothetical protein
MQDKGKSKKIAIVQSSYIPWLGYFDLINSVNEFVIYDDVQFTKRDWRSRNCIKTTQGLQWLTIPIKTKGMYHQKINEAEIADSEWAGNHFKSIQYNYKKTKYYQDNIEWLHDLYKKASRLKRLTDINQFFIREICSKLAITTPITSSDDYGYQHLTKTDRLLAICKAARATEYVSGPAAKSYIEDDHFISHDLKLTYFQYKNYGPYEQLYGDFIPTVSVVDFIFNSSRDVSQFT